MLGDDTRAALVELRAHAESRMRRPCVIRPTVSVEPDETGRDVVTYGPATYTGLCRIGTVLMAATEESSASNTISTTRRTLHLVWDAPPQPNGAAVFLDGSDAASWRIIGPPSGDAEDEITAARYPVERVS